MAMTSGSRSGISSDMNVTPMIDVLLVLLVIFMLIETPRQWQEKVDIPQKSEETKATPPPQTIVIQVGKATGEHPELKINEEVVSWQRLEPRLREIFSSRAERIAFVKGDPEIEFEPVAQVIDMAHNAGVDRVGLMPGTVKEIE